jgi:hypothetical protein
MDSRRAGIVKEAPTAGVENDPALPVRDDARIEPADQATAGVLLVAEICPVELGCCGHGPT